MTTVERLFNEKNTKSKYDIDQGIYSLRMGLAERRIPANRYYKEITPLRKLARLMNRRGMREVNKMSVEGPNFEAKSNVGPVQVAPAEVNAVIAPTEMIVSSTVNTPTQPADRDPFINWDNKFMRVEKPGEMSPKPKIVY